MKKEIIGFNKEKKGEITLVKELIDNDVNMGSIYYKFINENCNIHIGTAFRKNRSLVNGGGAKPWKQKGTGRARAGTRRSPVFVGGGVAFGNQRKNYKFKLPRKIKYTGVIALFNTKFKMNLISIVENIQLNSPKVSEFVKLVKNIINFNKKIVLIVKDIDENLKKAVRNIKKLKLLSIKRIIIRDLINDKQIYITKDAIEYLNETIVKSKTISRVSKKKKETR